MRANQEPGNKPVKNLSISTPIKANWSQLLKAGQDCSSNNDDVMLDGNNRHFIIYILLGYVNTDDGQLRSS